MSTVLKDDAGPGEDEMSMDIETEPDRCEDMNAGSSIKRAFLHTSHEDSDVLKSQTEICALTDQTLGIKANPIAMAGQDRQFASHYIGINDGDNEASHNRGQSVSVPSRREIWNFRRNYILRGALSGFPRYWKSRMPKGRAVWLILVINFLERISYFGISGNVFPPFLAATDLSAAVQAFIQAILLNVFADLLYPIAGWMADVWFGRYRTIQISLWLLLVGYAAVALTFSVSYYSTNGLHEYQIYILPIIFVVISIGTAGLQVNIIPYGADQLAATNANAEQLSSYFHWYYLLRNVGALTFVFSVICSSAEDWQRSTIFGCIATGAITLSLMLWVMLKDWLFVEKERLNPWKSVIKVVHYAATVKRPRERSAFSYGGRIEPSRFDLAKQTEGGAFVSEEVEDVKSFLRLLLVMVAIGGAFMVYTGITGILRLQIEHFYDNFLSFKFQLPESCSDSSITHWTVNILTIVAIVPILDQIVHPILREYAPSLLKRIALGYAFTFITPVLLLIYEHAGHHNSVLPAAVADQCLFVDSDGDIAPLQLSSYVILIPYLSLNFGEIFVNISGLEFFYAQSPHNMRGMMIGLFFFTQGLFGTVAAFLLFIFSSGTDVVSLNIATSGESCGFWYLLMFVVVVTLSLPLFIVVCWRYKKRNRGELEATEAFYRL